MEQRRHDILRLLRSTDRGITPSQVVHRLELDMEPHEVVLEMKDMVGEVREDIRWKPASCKSCEYSDFETEFPSQCPRCHSRDLREPVFAVNPEK